LTLDESPPIEEITNHMKPPQFLITLILSAICVFLSLLAIWQQQSLDKASAEFEKHKNDAQAVIAKDQGIINNGNRFYQVLNRMVQEIETVTDESNGGKRDDALKELLATDVKASGFDIKVPPPSASPSPASTSHH
jgi:hypothetical protein